MFQSQYGLILVFPIPEYPISVLVSIPIWSDFSLLFVMETCYNKKVSIPIWSDFSKPLTDYMSTG